MPGGISGSPFGYRSIGTRVVGLFVGFAWCGNWRSGRWTLVFVFVPSEVGCKKGEIPSPSPASTCFEVEIAYLVDPGV